MVYPKLFITYQYFTPAYKAGGPVQSLNNMVKAFEDKQVNVYVYCSNTEIDGTILTSVKHDEWQQYSLNTKVYYGSGKESVYELLAEVEPDVIFINGLFSYPFTLKPLFWSGNARKILSARGMLHPGALSQKPLKKKVFINIFKLLNLHKKCEFHATTVEEENYIKVIFGKGVKVWIAANFPKTLSPVILDKQAGELTLLTIALVSPMKNIKLVLEALQRCKSNIRYNIYGPVKDKVYWTECKAIIAEMPANIKVDYHGSLEPDNVEKVMKSHHCFIMPSKSENFGHSIYEALSAGKPVITSVFTPWNDLEKNKAGHNVDIDNVNTITTAIENIASVNNDEYMQWSDGAVAYSKIRINTAEIMNAYRAMFKIA